MYDCCIALFSPTRDHNDLAMCITWKYRFGLFKKSVLRKDFAQRHKASNVFKILYRPLVPLPYLSAPSPHTTISLDELCVYAIGILEVIAISLSSTFSRLCWRSDEIPVLETLGSRRLVCNSTSKWWLFALYVHVQGVPKFRPYLKLPPYS